MVDPPEKKETTTENQPKTIVTAEAMEPVISINSPYYLGSSDQSHIAIVSEPLRGSENYKVWCRQIKISLQAKNKLGFFTGIDEITIDVKGKKLTVIETVDPVSVVSKLRKKNWPTAIISVGPAKEPEKKEESKKEQPKQEEGKKEEAKEDPKKEEAKKEEAKKEEPKEEEEKKAGQEPVALAATPMPYRPYHLPNTY